MRTRSNSNKVKKREVKKKPHRKAAVGGFSDNFWLYDSQIGFDLSRPENPPEPEEGSIEIKTTDMPIKIDPKKSAIVIVDMQNMFLSTNLGRSPDSNGLKAQQKLLDYVIPAARKAGIRIIWLNWGLTEDDIDKMPPAVQRAFGLVTHKAEAFEWHRQFSTGNTVADRNDIIRWQENMSSEPFGQNERVYKGLGQALGPVKLKDGSEVDAGHLLMRDQWNSQLTPELEVEYRKGLELSPPDVWIHKDRMSGFWHENTDGVKFLKKERIQTLFFTGVNTDQCVWGSLNDAFNKGYDCVLLSDGCGTSTPDFAQQCAEFNANVFGFCTDCKTFSESIEAAKGS